MSVTGAALIREWRLLETWRLLEVIQYQYSFNQYSISISFGTKFSSG